LIDGDGCFLLSTKGYGSLEITMDLRDSYCLSRIKNKYGGSLKLRSGSHSIRYRLHSRDSLINLLNNVNGLIRKSSKLLQYSRLCIKYNIIILPTKDLFFESG
jgi:ubiquinol-cytochrome c reductase cytochrome b subunit